MARNMSQQHSQRKDVYKSIFSQTGQSFYDEPGQAYAEHNVSIDPPPSSTGG